MLFSELRPQHMQRPEGNLSSEAAPNFQISKPQKALRLGIQLGQSPIETVITIAEQSRDQLGAPLHAEFDKNIAQVKFHSLLTYR
jgi:hypothetical protein